MQITFTTVRRGERVGAVGDRYIGRVLGDFATGFWAIRPDGHRLPGHWDAPEEAFEVLALEAAFATVAA
ncbi:hypothetical protein [Phycicoccus sp. 3266]|uniref:hypothetical protein n=1 Tax=Phycicoccus sp. 3266 TaxID=2817751 RepID=UPI002858E7B1|nr:hypothetical protein [Phycicoccus sp. 3266]MDR6861997.1 hypothetical protein [Phycicoccus sp. 3266]